MKRINKALIKIIYIFYTLLNLVIIPYAFGAISNNDLAIYYPDASSVDQSVIGNGRTIRAFIDAVETSKKTTIRLRHTGVNDETKYNLLIPTTIPANIVISVEPGAILDGIITFAGSSDKQIDALPGQNIFASTANVSINGGTGYPEWYGADGSGISDSAAAIKHMDAALGGGQNSRIVGLGNYLICSQLILKSHTIDFKNSIITMGAAFPSNEGIVLTGFTNEPLNVYININGAKLNQTGTGIGVALRDISSPLTDININASNCKIGIMIDGNSERLNVHAGIYLCDIGVYQTKNKNTPDENYYKISGSLCDTWFHQNDSTSAIVDLNVENNEGSTKYAVIIEGSKYTSLRGMMRGSVAGGVYINASEASSHAINFDNFCIYGTSGNYALYAFEGRQLTGTVNIITARAGGAYIGYFIPANLNISVDGLSGGYGLRLGENGVKAFRMGNIKYAAYGNSGSSYGVLIDNVTGALNLDMVASDHTLSTNNIQGQAYILMSTRHIAGNIEISINDETPSIQFIGGEITGSELSAYSYTHNGMKVDTIVDKAYQPSIAVGTYWDKGTVIVVGTVNIPTVGTVYLNGKSAAVKATLLDGAYVGQTVRVGIINSTNPSTLTVLHHEMNTPEVFVFDTITDYLILEWNGKDWLTIKNIGVTS